MFKLSSLLAIFLYTCLFATVVARGENVYHVNIRAANASDKNAGTEKEPWRTLAHAGKSVKAGDTVLIHPGTYYEALRIKETGTEDKPICFFGTELGKVILDGSTKIEKWNRSPENPQIWVAKSKLEVIKLPKHQIKYYNTADPRDLTMDDNPLFFTHNKRLLPGSWTVDKEQNLIFARLPDDSDPNLHKMRVIRLMYGVHIEKLKTPSYTKYVQIKNLIVKRFVSGIRVMGPNVLIENNIVEWCEFVGWHTYGNYAHDAVLKDNIFRWCGHKGIVGTSRAKFINNKMLFSNWKLSYAGWDSAGIKCLHALDTLYQGNECAYNAGCGLWLDSNNQGLVLENNIVHDNLYAGLEDEISFSNTWKNNISYRNWTGFYLANTSNTTVENNIFADNAIGLRLRFDRRTDHMPKPDDMDAISHRIKGVNRFNTPARAQRWLDDFLKYCSPCRMVRDNRILNNLFINNHMEINNSKVKVDRLADPAEKYFIDNNIYSGNIFVTKDPSKLISSCQSLDEFMKDHPESNKCQYFSELASEKLPEWARTLYKRHIKRLDYPRSYKSIASIKNSLLVRNPQASNYGLFPSPAGFLALARICESDILEKTPFSDKNLFAYKITCKGKPSIVLWRKHGRPGDFVPILLKGVPKNAILETSWGAKIPVQRKGDLASINVGTWPIYLYGCSEKLTEVQPFKISINGKVGKDSKIEVKLTDCVGNGKLYIDSFNDKIIHPNEVLVSKNSATIPITMPIGIEIASLRVAGTRDNLYSGKIVKLIEKVSKSKLISLKGFNSIPLTKSGNCALDKQSKTPELLQLKNGSLANIPETLKLGNITFNIDKKSCIGLASKRIKEKRPTTVTIPLSGGKYKAFAFLHVVAFAPKEKGVDLMNYTLDYSDFFSETIRMKNALHLLDWWPDPEGKFIQGKNNSYLVWSGDNGAGRNVHVYAHVWENPSQEKYIKSLTIGGGDLNKKTTFGILAINGLKKK